jgi:kumamolisin
MAARQLWAIAFSVLALTATGAGVIRFDGSAAPSSAPPIRALVTDQVPLRPGEWTTPLPSSSDVRLSFSLSFSNQTRLDRVLSGLSDPASPLYRTYLTPSEFRSEFAPSLRNVSLVENALRVAGASRLSVAPGRLGVEASVPVGELRSLVGVELVSVDGGPGQDLYSAIGTPRLSSSLTGVVSGVGGLSDLGNARAVLTAVEGPARPVSQFVIEQGTNDQWDVGSDFAQAFGATSLWPGSGTVGATYPSNIAIATLLASSYDSAADHGAGMNLPPFDPAVVGAYFNATLAPGWPVPTVTGVPVTVDSVTPPLPGSLGALNDTSSDEYENSLDLEMAGSLAPGAALYNFYFPGSVMSDIGLATGDVADDFALDLSQALAYDYAPDHLAVISGSFGLLEQNDSLWDSGLEEAAALGVTVVCASGDQGDAPGLLTDRGSPSPTWPATAAFDDTGTISVGGTTVTLAGTPTSTATPTLINATYDSSVTGVESASAWYEDTTPGQSAGSEGGASSVFPEPSWQFHSAAQPAIVNATEHQGSYFAGRAGPDVAFPANDTIAFVFANATGTVFLDVLGGTSVAAPVFAGLIADIVAVDGARAGAFEPLGFLDPVLYHIASYFASAAVRNSSEEADDPFLDVVTGSNYLFSAAPGWDAVTGWGELSAPKLLVALDDPNATGYVYTGPTPSLPPRPTTPFFSAQTEYYLIAIAALVAIALVIVAARPSRGPSVSPPPRANVVDDPFATPPVAPAPSGSMFSCPYCGGQRPAEPVRCPHCGQL